MSQPILPIWRPLALLLLGLFPAQSFAQGRLAQVGRWHGEEVQVRAGDTMLGLFSQGRRAALAPVTVEARSVFDPIVDSDGRFTGVEVDVDRPDTPVLLIAGVPGLQPGPASTWIEGVDLVPGQQWDLGNAVLEAHADQEGRGTKGGEWTVYRLELVSAQGRQQLVEHIDVWSGAVPRLEWAGDLDGDGQVDVLVDLSGHANVSQLTLFLSSVAEDGDAVGQVAEWVTTGC